MLFELPAHMGAMLWVGAALALCIDQWPGEPPPRWHAVVWMGSYLAWAGQWLQRRVKLPNPLSPSPFPACSAGEPNATSANTADTNARSPTFDTPIHNSIANALPCSPLPCTGQGLGEKGLPQHPDYASFWRGAAAWMLGASLVLIPACLLQWLMWQLPWGWAALLTGVLLKPLLAWRMLSDEVLAVENQLAQSLAQGQQQLARIVSRDVTTLDATQVRESALESLAENLNDSVIAPLFWFALLGLPGAALYRFANTADSMWGYRGSYRGQHWEWAGKFAAKVDDALAWLPARITGFAMLLIGKARKLTKLSREAAQTPSPNSGWPMAALALALHVRLRKPDVYVLNAQGSQAQPEHTAQAVRLAMRTVLAMMAFWGLALAAMVACVYAPIHVSAGLPR